MKQGDIIFVNLSPTKGHEQFGARPALIVSNNDFSKYTGLYAVCPITSTMKAYPSHVKLDGRTNTHGMILCEQVRVIDLNARQAIKKEECPADILNQVLKIVKSIF